jgi:hypothetical protein
MKEPTAENASCGDYAVLTTTGENGKPKRRSCTDYDVLTTTGENDKTKTHQNMYSIQARLIKARRKIKFV